jgi:hypothetical protein
MKTRRLIFNVVFHIYLLTYLIQLNSCEDNEMNNEDF